MGEDTRLHVKQTAEYCPLTALSCNKMMCLSTHGPSLITNSKYQVTQSAASPGAGGERFSTAKGLIIIYWDGGLQNGKITGLKPFAPPQDRV